MCINSISIKKKEKLEKKAPKSHSDGPFSIPVIMRLLQQFRNLDKE